MPLTGCYETHLYCDTPTCKNTKSVGGRPPGYYTGRNERETWTAARLDGWHRLRNPHGGWLYFCGDCRTLFRRNDGP